MNGRGQSMNLTSEAFVTRAWRTVLALLTLVIVIVGPAHAQSTHIQPKLVAESAAPAPGSSTTLALTMAPEATWHGYWANGGDAGFGLSVEWNAPEGVKHLSFKSQEYQAS